MAVIWSINLIKTIDFTDDNPILSHFFALPWIEHPAWVILTLALLHSAYSVYTIAVKACFADWLPVNERIKAFSANYTLVNVGWAIGR